MAAAHYTRLAIASPAEIEHTARQLAVVREAFLTNGTLAQNLRPVVLKSWQRCRTMHVDPGRRYAVPAIIRDVELQERLEANEELLRAAQPVIRHLTDLLAETGYVVVLADSEGCILLVHGDKDILNQLAQADLIPGSIWSEAAAGTNAIGTALADGHVVQLMAAEHYCSVGQGITCTAAPIRHPLTGAVIGVLNVTGDYRLVRPHLVAFVTASALEIGQELQALIQSVGSQRASLGRSWPGVLWSRYGYNRAREGREGFDSKEHTGVQISTPLTAGFGTASPIDDHQERRVRDAELLAVAGAAISASLDLGVTLRTVAEQVGHVLRLDGAAVCLFDEQGGVAHQQVWVGAIRRPLEVQLKLESLLRQKMLVSLVLERGEPLIIGDVFTGTQSTGLTKPLGPRAAILLPLATARGVIGFIYASPGPEAYQWSVNDMRLGLGLANQAATAIENAKLFEALQQHNRQIEALNVVAQLLSTLPDPSQYLDRVLKRTVEIMGLEVGMIFLQDHEAKQLRLVAHCGLPDRAVKGLYDRPLPLSLEVVGQVAITGKSLFIHKAYEDERMACDRFHLEDVHDVMVVPLATNGCVLGVFMVGSRTPQDLSEEDLALFTAIGRQIGLAMENARLLRAASEIEALRQADQLKAEFLAAVSHDLRSPLTAIRASIEGLLDRSAPRSAQEQLLRNIDQQASRLARLVDRLLDLSRIEAGALPLDQDWVELPALIADVVAKFKGLNTNRSVELAVPADLPLQYVDPDRLGQVLWNLLENAHKYAPPSTPIEIGARWTETGIQMSVADHGPGIPEGEKERIFERFYRLERERHAHTAGSGLGLAICRGIVEAHGGHIWVEDRPGGGSIFFVSLPPPSTKLISTALEDELQEVLEA